MARLAAIAALLALGACGAGGEPMRPGATAQISAGTGGVNTSAQVYTTNGKLTLGVGL